MEASADLTIAQWRQSPNLRGIIEVWLGVVRDEFEAVVSRLESMGRVDEAEGVWLDYLGERVGLSRPFARQADDSVAFGFDDAGVGFDQGRVSNVVALEPRPPVGDALYRRLIKARAAYDVAPGTLASYRNAMQYIDPNAIVTDNHDMTFRVATARSDDVRLADTVGALPRPAGVRMVVQSAGKFGYDDAGVGFGQGGLND